MTKQPSLAIQYVNYKTKHYLKDSLLSLVVDAEKSGINYHVYILDNASGDDLSDLQQDKVTIMTSEVNIGFGAGHNLLSEQHASDYMLLLNPDTLLVEENTVERMIRSLEQSVDAVALGPCLIGADKKPQAWDHGELDFKSGLYSPKSYWKKRTKKSEVAWVSGAASLIKTDAFKNVGGFDKDFFLYKEEEDLLLRLRQSGLKTFYDPSIKVLHIGSVVANKDLPYFEESIAIYDRKHLS
nr:Glycosyl transferase family 2 [uncultured bacterium]AIA14850.1 Glycosyl transferase family 2 [uncultured bacterium]